MHCSADSKTETVDNLLLQWQQIEAQRSQLNQQWQMREKVLRQQLQIMGEEQSSLQQLLSEKGAAQSDSEAERQALLKEQSGLESQQTAMQSAIQQAKSQVMAMYAQLPPVLQTSWQPHINHLTTDTSSASDMLNHIAEAVKKLHAFNQRIVLHQTVMSLPDQQEKQVQVKQLFIGTAKAWYLSADGNHVGEGAPSPEGWQWVAIDSQDTSVSAALSALITTLEEPSKAQWVSLPLALNQSASSTPGTN